MIYVYDEIKQLISSSEGKLRSETLAEIPYKDGKLPILKLTAGSEDPKAPVLGFIGGVHGLERIGTQVCLSFLKSFVAMLSWDQVMNKSLKHLRVFFIPMVNPVGLMRASRSNPQGVDIMRNAPVDAKDPALFLGGHRLSPLLPWYRGEVGTMELETKALIEGIEKEVFKSSLALTVDLHSGFGLVDRLWFPYAKSMDPIEDLAYVVGLQERLMLTYPNHIYHIEPQAISYTTHGDVWDYLYDGFKQSHPKGLYLPLSLEMGSWLWIKKNPSQLFSAIGPFNPIKSHRLKRTLRRHLALFDFSLRLLCSPQAWAIAPSSESLEMWKKKGLEQWYD